MDFKALFFSPQILPQPHKLPVPFFPFPSIKLLNENFKRGKIVIPRAKGIGDAELAAELAEGITRRNNQSVRRKEAMKKSRQLLFEELCGYLQLTTEEVEKRWRKVDEEEKMSLVRGFVSEWGTAFHPLSSKSVMELVEEHLAEEENPTPISNPSLIFPGLRKIMGF
ncbi:uncharacterized protein LOC122093545 [Macadamia integrifolia]|uniref:uncharacterized protein LOC122093545 n=1 Tax=Macadamia integrifolia TaxID=60698 RepID=UPI001C52DB0C|nr:uncharacterized protein LOC122093545 [Macadamia integrifolia]